MTNILSEPGLGYGKWQHTRNVKKVKGHLLPQSSPLQRIYLSLVPDKMLQKKIRRFGVNS
jgi:hypothetical protein